MYTAKRCLFNISDKHTKKPNFLKNQADTPDAGSFLLDLWGEDRFTLVAVRPILLQLQCAIYPGGLLG
jgi:hypothetical protein